MTSILNRIHARVGDLWWYSAMIFVASFLTVLILASGFVAAIGQLIGSTQQGLKRFKTMSFTAMQYDIISQNKLICKN